MKVFLIFLLAINCFSACFTMEVGVMQATSILKSMISEISGMIASESKQLSSLEANKNGSKVNVRGTILALPNVINITLTDLQTISTSFFNFLGLLQQEYSGNDDSGRTLTIPNGVIQPYITLFNSLETEYKSIIFYVENIDGIVQNSIIPQLTTLQSNGDMFLPAITVSALEENINEIINELQSMTNSLSQAARESNGNHTTSESYKTNQIMGEVNGACAQLTGKVNNISHQVTSIMNKLPIQKVSGSQDEINAKYIINALINVLDLLSQLLKSTNGYLTIARDAIDVYRNPFMGRIISWL